MDTNLKFDIYTHGMDVTDHIQNYVEKKVSKLGKFLSNIEEVRVDLSLIKHARSAADRQVAQLTIRGKGYILRTEERSEDLYAAIDQSVDKMQRQIGRLKGKRAKGRGDGVSASEIATEEIIPVEDDGDAPVIVRR